MKKSVLILLLVLKSTFGFSQQIFTESFNYPTNANLSLNNWTAHSGAGTNAIKVGSGLEYTGITTQGGAAILTTSGEDINRQLGSVFSSGVVYARFLINVSAAQDAGDYFFHLGPQTLGTTFRGKAFVKKSTKGFQIGVTKAGNAPVYSSSEYELNKTHVVVIKYTFKSGSSTDDEVVLYINPTLEKEPTMANSTTPSGETDAENIGSVALRQGAAANAPSVSVDEIKVSSSWNDLFTNTPTETIKVEKTYLKANLIYSVYLVNKGKFVLGNFGEPQFTYIISGLTPESTVQYKTNHITLENGANGRVFKMSESPYYKNGRYSIYDTFLPTKADVESNYEGDDTLKFFVNNKLVYSEYLKVYYIRDNAPEGISISTLRKVNKTFLPNAETIRGRITSINQINDLLYIEDNSGGIPISLSKSSNLPANFKPALGDSIEVSLSAINFDYESNQAHIAMKESGIKLINAASKQKTPKLIKITDLSANEGNLVSITDVSFTDKKFVFLPNTNYTISDGKNNGIVRIWESTDIEGRTKPQSAVTITGVVGRFGDTYQIYPRSQSDIPTTGFLSQNTSNIPLDKTLDVVAWNVEWFGNKSNGPSDEALQQTNVKRVLDSLKADVYVLSEVSNQAAFNDLISKISGYKGVCSSAVSAGGIADDAQRVCIVYKESVFSNVSSRPLLKGTTPIANYPDSFDRFWASGRLPFLFTADATAEGGKRRINIVGIHARANTASDIPNSERIYQQRKIDVEVLKDTLDKNFKDEAIIIAGDFNDDVDETVVAGISTKESSYKKYVDDTENWQAVTKTLSENGYRSYLSQDNMIDHIAISNELKSSYVSNSTTIALPFTYITNYRNTTSDHIPVMARFQLQALPLATEEEVVHLFGKVYPNPSDGNIEFEVSENLKNKQFQFLLTNQLSQTLFSQKAEWTALKSKINEILNKSASGHYLLKVSNETQSQTFRIVKE